MTLGAAHRRRPGPRAGCLAAPARRHADTLGVAGDIDVDATDPLVAPGPAVEPDRSQLVPLERLAVPHPLSGEQGANRAPAFPYIAAQHDLATVRAYLNRYASQGATQRAYRRELERFLLWAIVERGVALSSLLVEDCDAYKAFLAAPADAFCGPPASRASGRWRPFAPRGLSLESQLYAVRTLRAAFEWLVKVRYLAGNPCAAVTDPKPVKRARKLQIERALPFDLWVRASLAAWCDGAGPAAPRWRAARALLLLMGDAGLRIAEAAAVARPALELHPADGEIPATGELRVIGKGNKERFVPIGAACVDALRAQWRDRGHDFDGPGTSASPGLPLIAPLVITPTPRARANSRPTASRQMTRRRAAPAAIRCTAREAWCAGPSRSSRI